MRVLSFLITVFYSVTVSLGMFCHRGDNWQLNIPEYEGGRISSDVYLDGSGLLNDENGPTGKESLMQAVSFTDADEFADYCRSLTENGFDCVYENAANGITSAAFRSESKLIYLYFCEKTKEARIIEDNVTNSLEDFGYTGDEGAGVTVYQFDYPYADFGSKKDQEIYSTNGMMYIIRLADNSLVIIDGGSIRQSSDENIEQCMKLLHKITGTAENEKVTVSLWYGTHGHSDHVTFFYKLLGYHHKDINLERVMFNYPSLSLVEHDGRIDMFRDRLAVLYPGVKYLAPHTGMSFDVDNLHFDVLYTHEDAVRARSGKTPVTNTNDGSTVCRLTAAGKRFLVLGDMNILAQDKIFRMYDADIVKTDVLQAAHHLYNAVDVVYDYADAEYVFCPMSEGRARAGLPGYTGARLFYKKSQLLFADNALYSVEMSSSGVKLNVDHTQCVPYDDSSMNGIR